MAGRNAQQFINGARFGSIDPLMGEAPTWRMAEESEPIYLSMLADGYRSPWLADDDDAPHVMIQAEVLG